MADILLAIEKIRRFTAELDHEMFLVDEKTIDAVARNIGIIGEAVRQLPDDFKTDNDVIPWSVVGRGLRLCARRSDSTAIRRHLRECARA